MRDVIYMLFHLLTTLAKLIRPGGGCAVIAENLLLKQQLIIHGRSRQRAPNLTTRDRALLKLSLANSHFKQPLEAEKAHDRAFPSGSYGDQWHF